MTSTRAGLTSPKTRVVPEIMSRRLSTLVPLDSATMPIVAAAIDKTRPAPARQRCLNPECTKKITRPRAGRLPLFCDRKCRQAFDYERAELLADIAVLSRAVQTGGGSHAEQRRVVVELADRRWCLQRYAVPPDRTRPEILPMFPEDR